MPAQDKYTDPKLRDEVKQELHEGDKGGAPGQWSARKAQMMASEYKKRGGDYNTDKSEKDESQKNLENWGKEDWQTKEGSGNAKQKDGSQKRYLPKKAWENMTDQEKKKTDDKKLKESKRGKQHVANTDKAKDSRKKASERDNENDEEEEDGQENNADKKSTRKSSRRQSAEKQTNHRDSSRNQKDDDQEEDDEDAEGREDGAEGDEEDEEAQPGQKRGRKQPAGSAKKHKSKPDTSQPSSNGSKKTTIGSKHMDATEPGKRGSADRLPKKGQAVSWKAMPGYVDGKLQEVLKKDKQIDGKSVKASEKDPKLVLKSNSSGKICVHKPEACFYE